MSSRSSHHEDERFGLLAVDTDPAVGRVGVSGSRIPPASAQRSGVVTADERTPIGTRDAAALLLCVDDVPVPLRPGPGFLTRRSLRVDVEFRDRRYRFIPETDAVSVFLRDRRPCARVTCGKPGELSVSWEAEAEAEEASLLYVLAGAFGVGAAGGLKTAIGKGIVISP
ncbi:hypothetical protein ACFXDJ_30980 [Streptomyces sp. NPDC059443]|uniref:hypothetical protein n=1 Tax=unclassified Streptomyces TaxID=2593676 RepID=UPI0036895850